MLLISPNKFEAIRAELTEMRRYLHRNAEVGTELPKTIAYVEQTLCQFGYQPELIGTGGIVTELIGAHPGKTVLLRADMDALPITEESGEDFASTSGKMHACGHDMHTAMLLGTAKLLKPLQEKLHGRVRFLFQPAEEQLEGAKDMISHGILEKPTPDAAIMVHVLAGLPLPTGTVLVPAPGVGAPAASFFRIDIQGKGCHGSSPHTGIDPISVAAHILLALQELHARELSPLETAALTIGCFQAGDAANVIPDTALLRGTMRSTSDETIRFLRDRVETMAAQIATAFRTTAHFKEEGSCPTLRNSEPLSKFLLPHLKELLGSERVLTVADFLASSPSHQIMSSGSEDFAYISHRVPSLMLSITAGSPEEGFSFPQHHPAVRFHEDVLPLGSAVYANAALFLLSEP